MIYVKVRFRGERRWCFLAGGGRVTHLLFHARSCVDEASARRIAADIISYADDDVVASRIDVDGRTIARFGEPTPARPVYGPAGGYRYLVSARRGRGTFHVRGDRGGWGHVTATAYNACQDEAKRAGLRTDRLTIHGAIATIQTRGLHFVQRWDCAA